MFKKFSNRNILLYLKGFAMGSADVVPGVSGGTVALITGIYDELVKTIGSFDHRFLKILLTFNVKNILAAANTKFLFPLGFGIISSILLMARVMHYMIEVYPIYTWSTFFGLILASILFILKMVSNVTHPKSIASIIAGTLIGFLVVSLIPVQTPENYITVFLAGVVGICAMILPGISGSFILLILGKYYFITSMLKNPFAHDHLIYISVFCLGCGIGLLSFSKLINYLLEKFHSITMCVLIGFMIGSLKKIWPWKTIVESKLVNGKLKVLNDTPFFPSQFDSEIVYAFIFMIIGFTSVYVIEKISPRS
jgi:putative membrane protein